MSDRPSEDTALIAIRDGRPAVVLQDGCRVYIAVHDEWYRRRKADFKNRLRLAHPDMTPVQRYDVGPVAMPQRRYRAGWRRAHMRQPYTLHMRNTGAAFRRVSAAYQKWLAEEVIWYAAHALTPPEWGS